MNDKFEKVGGKVSFDQGEDDDLLFDVSLTWQERLERMEIMRRKIWTFRLGKYPEVIEKVGGKVEKINSDCDDF